MLRILIVVSSVQYCGQSWYVTSTGSLQFDCTLTQFRQHRIDGDVFVSPFYTHTQGYKLCLVVHANGYECTLGHMSVGICIRLNMLSSASSQICILGINMNFSIVVQYRKQ